MSSPSGHQEGGTALERLVDREEVLQICYWYQGESLGDVYSAALLGPFLGRMPPVIESALQDLARIGLLAPVEAPTPGYRFTAAGKQQAGRLFAEGFADYQKSGHGECDAGCCDGDDHSKCGDECSLH